jgi:hypothetical protein
LARVRIAVAVAISRSSASSASCWINAKVYWVNPLAAASSSPRCFGDSARRLFDQLQTEGNRLADKLRIIVRSECRAAAGQSVSDLVDGGLAYRTSGVHKHHACHQCNQERLFHFRVPFGEQKNTLCPQMESCAMSLI